MSLPQDLTALARTLAHLAVTGSSSELDSPGLGVALRARRELLGLLREVLNDASTHNSTDSSTGSGPPGGLAAGTAPSIADLEQNPVAVLAQVLAEHPAPRGLPLDELGQHDQVADPAGLGWPQVARHALLARHEWSLNPAQLSDEQRWSAVADVAALAQTLTVLDTDLQRAAARNPDTDPALVDQLTAAASSGLGVCAGHVGQLAATGQLPPWGEPGPLTGALAGPTGVMLVRSARELEQAQARLPAQVHAAEHLSPAAVALLLTGQTRALAAAATALRATDPQRAERADHLAQQLRSVAPASRELAALLPDDLRPVAQTRELLQHLNSVGARGWTSPAVSSYLPALATVIDRSPAIVQALAQQAHRSLGAGHWLTRNPDAERADQPLWRLAQPTDPAPKLLHALDAVSARNLAAAALTPNAPSHQAPTPARQVLAESATARAARPTRPGQRPGPGAGRE